MPQVIVPSKFFRDSVKALYAQALSEVGVIPDRITVHLDSSATVNVSQADVISIGQIDGVMLLSDHSAKGNLRMVIPAAIDFLMDNDPTVGTSEKRETRNPMTEARKAALAQRREKRDALKQLLAERYGIGDDSEGDSDA